MTLFKAAGETEQSTGARWMVALATGYILMFYSEFVFIDVFSIPVPDLPLTLAIYVVEAFIFLTVVDWFRVRSTWALFLAGACYGWMLEGIVSPTMYESFPLYVSFTALAWHAPLDVMIGWYFVNRVLRTEKPLKVGIAAGLIGLFWGFWAIWPWAETGIVIPLIEFAALTWLSTLLLIGAYWLFNQAQRGMFRPGRDMILVLVALHAAIFLMVVVPNIPLAGVVLPPLLALVFFALDRNRRSAGESASILAKMRGDIRPLNYAALLMLPLAATLSYAGYGLLDAALPTNVVVFMVSVPVGFLLFIASAAMVLYRSWQQREMV